MTNKNKDIVYKEVFNNLPKIQNSHQSIIGRLQNNNFIRCYHFIFDNYYTKIFFFHFLEIIIYQIKCIFYKFMIKPCNLPAFNQYIYNRNSKIVNQNKNIFIYINLFSETIYIYIYIYQLKARELHSFIINLQNIHFI